MTRTISWAFLAVAALCAVWGAAEDTPKSSHHRPTINRLVIDVRTSSMCWLEKPVKGNASLPAEGAIMDGSVVCPDELKWNPATDFFRTGDVVKVIIPKPRFMATFSATVNATPINEDQLPIRNLPSAGAVTPPAGAATKGVPEGCPSKSEDLRKEIERLQGYLPPADLVVVQRFVTLSQRATALEKETDQVLADLGDSGTKPYADLPRFRDFLDATDRLVGGFADLNPRLGDLSSDYFTEAVAATKWLKTSNLSCSSTSLANNQDLKTLCSLLVDLDGFKATMFVVFNSVNELWRRSQSEPYKLTLGQWSSGTTVDFQLNEIDHFQVYDGSKIFADKTAKSAPVTGGGTEPGAVQVQLPNKPATPAGNDKGKTQDKGGTASPTAAPSAGPSDGGTQPTFYFGSHFNVHPFYIANAVSGFVWTSLHTRSYGVETVRALNDTGQPLTVNGSPVYINVPTVGGVHTGQFHYYVGVDFYFKRHDFFPGSRPTIIPAMMFGYGVDDPFNFLLGLNLETKFGLTFGVGSYLGREQFLASGVVPGLNGTRLPDPTKAPPTANHFKEGGFVNVGFDFGIFKSLFGSLAGLK
jgi:hypothetical protein